MDATPPPKPKRSKNDNDTFGTSKLMASLPKTKKDANAGDSDYKYSSDDDAVDNVMKEVMKKKCEQICCYLHSVHYIYILDVLALLRWSNIV